VTSDLDPLLKRLQLANARRVWSDLPQRAEKEEWSYGTLLQTLFAEEVGRVPREAAGCVALLNVLPKLVGRGHHCPSSSV